MKPTLPYNWNVARTGFSSRLINLWMPPKTKMGVYNSGGSHLMSQVIRSATGIGIDQYAEQHLFDPLQIPDYHWKTTPKQLPDTEGGLYLEAAQLAKIGYLYLRGGEWNGLRILEEDFVRAAIAEQVEEVNRAGCGLRLPVVETRPRANRGLGRPWLWRSIPVCPSPSTI